MEILETKRLVIRKFDEKDADKMHKLFSDDIAMDHLDLLTLATLEESINRINEWSNDCEHFAIEKKDAKELIGYIAINPDSEDDRADTRELGFGLIEEYRGLGYMFETVTAVLNYLKSEGIKYVWACYFDGNTESEKLIKKLNFKLMEKEEYITEAGKTHISYASRIKL